LKLYFFCLSLLVLLVSCAKEEIQSPLAGDWNGEMILQEYSYSASGYANATVSSIDTFIVKRHAYELNGEIVANQTIKNLNSFIKYFFICEDHYHMQGLLVDTISYENELCRRERQFDIVGHLNGSKISEEGLVVTHIYTMIDTLQIPNMCSFTLTRQTN
jgi:hypothetical protein